MKLRPISTWKPKHGDEILGYGMCYGEINGESGPWITTIQRVGNEWNVLVTDAYSITMEPTYWMPIPKEPSE